MRAEASSIERRVDGVGLSGEIRRGEERGAVNLLDGVPALEPVIGMILNSGRRIASGAGIPV